MAKAIWPKVQGKWVEKYIWLFWHLLQHSGSNIMEKWVDPQVGVIWYSRNINILFILVFHDICYHKVDFFLFHSTIKWWVPKSY